MNKYKQIFSSFAIVSFILFSLTQVGFSQENRLGLWGWLDTKRLLIMRFPILNNQNDLNYSQIAIYDYGICLADYEWAAITGKAWTSPTLPRKSLEDDFWLDDLEIILDGENILTQKVFAATWNQPRKWDGIPVPYLLGMNIDGWGACNRYLLHAIQDFSSASEIHVTYRQLPIGLTPLSQLYDNPFCFSRFETMPFEFRQENQGNNVQQKFNPDLLLQPNSFHFETDMRYPDLAVERYPDSAEAFLFRARMQVDDANRLKDLCAAIHLNPLDAESHLQRGILYLSHQLWFPAHRDFQHAIFLDTRLHDIVAPLEAQIETHITIPLECIPKGIDVGFFEN